MEENEESEGSGMIDLSSKFWRTFLLIVGVLLVFAGPTYVPYVLNLAHVNYFASIGVGLVLFVVGLVLLFYLIRKKVIV
jgi:hypothetical protein